MTPFAQAMPVGGFTPIDDDFADEPEETPDSELYWAERSARGLFEALREKKRAFFDTAENWGLLNMWRLANAQHYGRNPDAMAEMETQQIGFDGDEGEIVRFRINDTRSYTRQQVALACQQRPAFQAVATNTDYASRAQLSSSDAAVDYIYAKNYGEKKERRVVEKGLVFGLGWTWLKWDIDGGEFVKIPRTLEAANDNGFTPNAPEYKRSGAPHARQLWPGAVFCEPYIEDDDEHLWRCVSDRVSRWQLIQMRPDLRDRLLGVSGADEYSFESVMQIDVLATHENDYVTVEHFYHERTADMPDGRYAVMVADMILQDGPLPEARLDEIVIPFCPGHHIGTMFGYADAWDMMSIQQVIDELASSVATNYSNYARQTIMAKEGTDFDLKSLANGGKFLTYTGSDKPEPVLLAMLPPGAQWIFDFLSKRMQGISGLNSVVRGQPDANITSGTMAALFHSIALEFNNAIEAAVNEHRERVANGMLGMYKRHAKTPFMVQVAGLDERPYMQAYTVDQLGGFDRVIIKSVNPLTKSVAGRLEIYDRLIKIPHCIETPEQAVTLINTGLWKPVTDVASKRLLRIQWENEQIMAGIAPPVLFSDNRMMETELLEHLKIADSPEWREAMMGMDPSQQAAANAALEKHILEHMNVWRTQTPPDVAMAIKIPLHPAMQAMLSGAGMAPAANDNGKGEEAGDGGRSSDEGRTPQAKDQGTGVSLPKPAEPPPGSRASNATR
jgi:hypothetical protein